MLWKVGERIIEVITAEKEFMIDRMEVKPTDFRGPRRILEEMAKDPSILGLMRRLIDLLVQWLHI